MDVARYPTAISTLNVYSAIEINDSNASVIKDTLEMEKAVTRLSKVCTVIWIWFIKKLV